MMKLYKKDLRETFLSGQDYGIVMGIKLAIKKMREEAREMRKRKEMKESRVLFRFARKIEKEGI